MKYTNNSGLPSAMVEAIQNDTYAPGRKGTKSVTFLLRPARINVLTYLHRDEITEDVADRAFAFYGQSVHSVLERVPEREGRIVERRFYGDYTNGTVSGQIDLYEDGIIYDYKVMSVWEIMNGLKDEKIKQLNILKRLMEKEGHSVKGMAIISMLRDWSRSKAKFDPNYPKAPIVKTDVPAMLVEDIDHFIEDRLIANEAANETLPLCTAEDRWEKETKFAVMKKGRKSALRLMPSEQEAWEWAMGNGHANKEENDLASGVYIEERKGEATRCEYYCPCAPYCDQFKESEH